MQRIPKTIHFIWLGNRKYDKVSIRCMETWKEILPDYEIVKWGDYEVQDVIKQSIYAQEAYNLRKYAFVSDFLRLQILYIYGGIYLDTDVEILKSIDPFLCDPAFTSFENNKKIPTALLGAAKGNPWIKMLLSYYHERRFILEDGRPDMTTNVEIITNLSIPWGLKTDGNEQVLKNNVHIYPREYFCPLDTLNVKNNNITNNTHAIHHFNGSWTPRWRRIASRIKKKYGLKPERLLGTRLYNWLR